MNTDFELLGELTGIEVIVVNCRFGSAIDCGRNSAAVVGES
jgi:hypothetical protein